MKYCEKCKNEYEDYVEVCSDCGQSLKMSNETSAETKHSDGGHIELIHLTLVNSDLEAERIIALLASEGIAAIKKFKGTGSYLNIVAAVNYQGVDIYVAEQDETVAKLLIAPIDELPEAYEDEMPFDEEDQALSKNRGRSLKWFIRLGYIVPMALFILFTVWKGIANWLK